MEIKSLKGSWWSQGKWLPWILALFATCSPETIISICCFRVVRLTHCSALFVHAHSQQNGFSQAVLCHMILTNTFCFPVEKVYPKAFHSKEKNMSIKYESKGHDHHNGMGGGGAVTRYTWKCEANRLKLRAGSFYGNACMVKIICCYIKSVACFSEWIVTVGLIRSHEF